MSVYHRDIIDPVFPFEDNAYVDKMFCYYCKRCKKYSYDKNICDKCGCSLFSADSINVYTPTIPTRYGYSYNHHPNHFPQVYYYGTYKNNLITLPKEEMCFRRRRALYWNPPPSGKYGY